MKRQRLPLVSVIMPVYNANGFLRDSIESVFVQTYSRLEIIAVDDGSTDDAYEILKDLKRKDKRLKILRSKKNYGLSHAANLGIEKVKGQFIARFDSDDLMPKDRFEKQVRFLLKHPKVVAVGGQCMLINEDGEEMGMKRFPLLDRDIRRMAFTVMSLQAGSMMVNRMLLPSDFKFYSSKYRYAEDHELLFKLLRLGSVANLPDTLLYYRQHPVSSTRIAQPKKVFFNIAKIRFEAMIDGFRPHPISFLIHCLQLGMVSVLPERVIPFLFSLLRGTKSISLSGIRVSLRFLDFVPAFIRNVRENV